MQIILLQHGFSVFFQHGLNRANSHSLLAIGQKQGRLLGAGNKGRALRLYIVPYGLSRFLIHVHIFDTTAFPHHTDRHFLEIDVLNIQTHTFGNTDARIQQQGHNGRIPELGTHRKGPGALRTGFACLNAF